MRMLLWGVVAMLALGVVGVFSGVVQLGPGEGVLGGSTTEGRDMDNSWSYYHDREFDTDRDGAKWATDRSRSTDPDSSVLGDTSRWEYDGPYRYGPYGSDGIRRRATGTEARDPLNASPTKLPDVFTQYGGDLDPSGGEPVGMAPSSMTTPYFDPYAGYANPYSNRIRMSYGEGVGRGASYDPMLVP